jgi:hypothetical protein
MAEKNFKIEYDPFTLGYAETLNQYLKQGKQGMPFVQIGLEKMYEEMNLQDSWIARVCSSPEAMASAIKNMSIDYRTFQNKQTIGGLIDHFSGNLEIYSEGGTGRVKAKLEDFLGESYGNLEDKIIDANRIIEDKQRGKEVSERDISKAQSLIQKYEEISATISIARNRELKEFQNKIEFTYNQMLFNQMYPESEKQAA